jgi:UDP-2,4-diacetamido-2,4,6-trideoxy-beta-L-altropyranose hydrolase
MRCLTLAGELRRRGCRVRFICRNHPGHMVDKIARKGFQVSLLPEPEQTCEACVDQENYAAWLGVTQDEDARQTMDALGTERPDWIIVDHYGIDAKWEKALRTYVERIMVIDDLADRKHDCELLLDQNYFQEPEKRYQGLLPDKCQALLGPKYALLRPEFRQARKFCSMRGNGVTRILLYLGGNDTDNLIGMALEALCAPELEHLFVEAVIGPNNQHQEQLEKQAKKCPGTRLHIQPENFTELMLRADFCIGAGGTTTWERLCLGLPSLVITVAENQVGFTKELDTAGYVCWLGNNEQVSVSDIRKSLISEIHKQQNQKKNPDLPSLVDGYGALRVAEKLVSSDTKDLSLRRAVKEDMELFFSWANDPEVRENSFQQGKITWDEHEAWFRSKLDSTMTEMWIMQTPYGLPVGQVRFDVDGEAANISYSLDPVARGRAWGVKIVELGINKIKDSGKGKMIQGKVKKSNSASKKIFIKLGFTQKVENDVFIFRKDI